MSDLSIKIEVVLPDAGVCFSAESSVIPTGKFFTVRDDGEPVYSVVEPAVSDFYTVVYGLIRRICVRIREIVRTFRNKGFLFLRGAAQLSCAGGLRL